MSQLRTCGTEPRGTRAADDVGHVGRLLGVDRHAVVDRHVGGDHHGVGADDMLPDVRQRGNPALDLVGVRAGEDAAALVLDRLGQAAQGT